MTGPGPAPRATATHRHRPGHGGADGPTPEPHRSPPGAGAGGVRARGQVSRRARRDAVSVRGPPEPRARGAGWASTRSHSRAQPPPADAAAARMTSLSGPAASGPVRPATATGTCPTTPLARVPSFPLRTSCRPPGWAQGAARPSTAVDRLQWPCQSLGSAWPGRTGHGARRPSRAARRTPPSPVHSLASARPVAP